MSGEVMTEAVASATELYPMEAADVPDNLDPTLIDFSKGFQREQEEDDKPHHVLDGNGNIILNEGMESEGKDEVCAVPSQIAKIKDLLITYRHVVPECRNGEENVALLVSAEAKNFEVVSSVIVDRVRRISHPSTPSDDVRERCPEKSLEAQGVLLPAPTRRKRNGILGTKMGSLFMKFLPIKKRRRLGMEPDNDTPDLQRIA